METQLRSIELLAEKTRDYGEARLELFRLKTIDKTADVVSSIAAKLAVIILFSLCFLALNTGVALWLGDLLGKNYYGFFITAAFYALAGIIFYYFRVKWVKKPVRDLIITGSLN